MRPRVTVVIPVRNGGNFLSEAIDSALAQTYPNVEVIVVDDGSTDGGDTARVATSYGNRVRFIRKTHGGVSSALNAAIRDMSGDYFAWLSHDDVYLPHKLERQVAALEREGSDTIAYSDYELVGPDLKRIKTKVLPDVQPAAFRLWLMADSALHGCTILVPRSLLSRDPFDERLATTQDYDMWFRLAKHHRFIRVPEVLLKYRIHQDQESWRNSSRVDEGNRLLIGFLAEMGVAEIRAATHEAPSIVYLRAAVRFKVRGYTEAAVRARALSREVLRTRVEAISPRRLTLLAAYHLANPHLRPMYWWKRLHFRTASAPEPMGEASARRTLGSTGDPADS